MDRKTTTKNRTQKSALLLALITTIFTTTSQLLFKIGSAKVTGILSFFNFFVIVGLFSYFLGSIFYLGALKKGELSVIAPMIALNFVWVAILSIILFGETINFQRWFGIISIVGGVIFVGLGGKYGN